jgi:hypothetical protein
MADPLFTTPCADFVPVVDFEFVEDCLIPSPPPPIYDCGAPTCPPLDIPPFCPDIKGGRVSVTVNSVRAGCDVPPGGGGRVTVGKTENCEFDIGLDLSIPIIMPPCPIINGGRVNVNASYGGCDTPPDSKVRVTPRGGDPCGDGACEFDIELDINVNIPTPPCPKINGGGISVTSSYGQCGGTSGGTINVTPRTVISPCGDSECEFDINADISVVVPFPGCPRFTKSVSTGTPSFDIRQISSPDCGDDGEPCSYHFDVVFPEVPPVPCPEITGGNIAISFSQSNQAYGSISVSPRRGPLGADECAFEVTGRLVIPSPPPIYPPNPNNPKRPGGGGGSNKPCIPKYTGGDIKISGNCGGTGRIIVGQSKADKSKDEPHCVYCDGWVPVENTAGSCWVLDQTGDPGMNAGGDCIPFGSGGSASVVSDCTSCSQMGGECYPQSNNCEGRSGGVAPNPWAITSDDRGAVVVPVEWECQSYACENFAGQADPESACAALGGTLRTGPCDGGGTSTSSCGDLEITAEITLDGDCGGTNDPDNPDNPDNPNDPNGGCGPLPEGGEVTVNGKSAGKLVVKKVTASSGGGGTSGGGSTAPVDPNTVGWCKLPSGECSRQEKGDCEASDGFNGTWYPDANGGCVDAPTSDPSSSTPCYTITAELNIPGVDMDGSSSSAGPDDPPPDDGGNGCTPTGGRITADGKDVGSIKIDKENTPDGNDTGSCRIRGECLSGYARGTCEDEGGTWYSGANCSEAEKSCYKITADINLNDALKNSMQFEQGEQKYTPGDCDSEPSVSVTLERGDDGKYKINTEMKFPDLKKCCCSIKEDADVENPGTFQTGE